MNYHGCFRKSRKGLEHKFFTILVTIAGLSTAGDIDEGFEPLMCDTPNNLSEEVNDSNVVRSIARAASGDPSREVGTGFLVRQVLRLGN